VRTHASSEGRRAAEDLGGRLNRWVEREGYKGKGEQIMRVLAAAIVGIALTHGGARGADFVLTSPDLKEGAVIKAEQVLNGAGCTGENVSPELRWSGVPAGAKSFALTMYDPDAPASRWHRAKSLVLAVYDPDASTRSGWLHWVLVNIPANLTSLPKNAGSARAGLAPAGSIQTRTSFGTAGWDGPCPPQGAKPHHYIFTIYALDLDKLPVDENTSAISVGFSLYYHTIGKATLTGTYGR
jgi:Raf kinase inhibitor-like YbhB/YbcL family protein